MEIFILILIILAFATIVAATLGFGDSLIFIAITALFINILLAIVLISFWSFWISVFNAIKYRKYIDKVFVKKNVPPGIIGAILGSLLITIAPLKWIELFLGCFILIYTIFKSLEIRKENRLKSETNSEFERNFKDISDPIFYLGSFSYGFFGGLIGASGPINVILLERKGHQKESFIVNFAICSVIISSFKLGIYLGSGLFPVAFLAVYLAGFVVIVLSMKLGHAITPKISKEKFQFSILMLLLIIGIRMIVNSLFYY